MSRLEATLRALILVAATALVTEWVHYRLGEPTVWRLLKSESTDNVGLPAEPDPNSVTEAEFQAYLQVLEVMQADHSLSVDRAAEARKMSLSRFREIERRAQRNDVLVERTREFLRKKAESLWDSRRARVAQGLEPPPHTPGA